MVKLIFLFAVAAASKSRLKEAVRLAFFQKSVIVGFEEYLHEEGGNKTESSRRKKSKGVFDPQRQKPDLVTEKNGRE